MAVTSVTGHLMSIDFQHPFNQWNSCPAEHLFHAPIARQVPSANADILHTLQTEAKKAQSLILWLDCDREGENIAFEVLEVCLKANPRLQYFRAQFSAFIPREIFAACRNLTQPNKNFSDAVNARMEIDLRIGAAFTRFQTNLLKYKFQGMPKVLSYGPCQFPTLGFIVDRQKQIEQFVPESYWNISCVCNAPAGRDSSVNNG